MWLREGALASLQDKRSIHSENHKIIFAKHIVRFTQNQEHHTREISLMFLGDHLRNTFKKYL